MSAIASMKGLGSVSKMDVLRKTAQVISMNFGINVVFRGNAAVTDGRTICVPSMPEDAPDDLIEAIIGFLDHEVGHIRFTDFKEKRPFRHPDKRVASLTNALEDIRQEYLMAAEYRGVGLNLEISILWAMKRLEAKWNSLDGFYRFDVLAMSYNRGYAQDIASSRGFYDRLAGELDPVVRSVSDLLLDIHQLPNTTAIYERALEILRRLDSTSPKQPASKPSPKKSAPPPPPEDEDDDDGGNEADPKKDLPGAKPDEDKDDADPTGDDAAPPPETGAGDEAPADEGDEGKDDEAGEDIEDGEDIEAGEGNDKDAGSSTRGTPVDEEEEGDDEGEGEGSAPRGDDPIADDPVDDAPDRGEGRGEGAGDDEGEEGDAGEGGDAGAEEEDGDPGAEEALSGSGIIAGVGGSEEHKGMFEFIGEQIALGAASSGGHRAFTTELDRSIPPTGTPKLEDYSVLAERVRPAVSVISGVLSRTLLAESRSRRVSGLREGRINTGALARLASGQGDIFRKIKAGRDLSTYVEIVVDHSGSMRSHAGGSVTKLQLAAETCIVLAEALERIKLNFGICGFTASLDNFAGLADPVAAKRIMDKCRANSELRFFVGKKKKGKSSPPQDHERFERCEPIIEYVYKTGQESFSAARPRLALMVNQLAGNNADGDSLLRIAQRVAMRPEKRKVIIVLSDGSPATLYSTERDPSDDYLKRIVTLIETTHGMDIVGIGIGTDAVRDYYRRSAVVMNIESLPEVAMKELSAALR